MLSMLVENSVGNDSASAVLRRLGLLADAESIAHFGTWEWDINNSQIAWSDELYRIYGLQPTDYQPTFGGYLSRIHPDDRTRVRSAMERVLKEHISFSHKERIIRPDGDIRYLHSWGHAYVDKDGHTVRLVGVCHDVTEHVLLEKAAKDAEENSISRLRATLESTADGILVMDLSNRVIGMNQRFLDLWQVPRELIEYEGYETGVQFVLGQLKDPEKCVSRLREIIADPRCESYDVVEFKDGRLFERYSRPQMIGNRPVGRVFSYRDVTEKIKAAEQIREYAARMKVLAEASHAFAEARLDLKAVLSRVSRWLAEVFNDGAIIRLFTPDHAHLETIAFHHAQNDVRKLMERFLPKATEFIDAQSVGAVMRTGKASMVRGTPEEIRLRLPATYSPFLQRYPVHSWMVSPLKVDRRVIGLISVFRFREAPAYGSEDLEFLQQLSDRAALAIDNANLYTKAQHAIELRDDFISIASHELRTPLTPLTMQLQLLREHMKVSELTPEARPLLKLLENSDEQIHRLTRLVEDMLDISRIHTGRLNLVRAPMDLSDLTRQVIDRFTPQAKAAKCDMLLAAPHSVVGQWDASRLEQVIVNLISNAIKYGAGKPIEVSVSSLGDRASLVVRDYGIGIAPEDQKRIFNRFERATSIRRFGGLGLGLFISQQIVEAHGGRIFVESAPAEGALFRVELGIIPSA